MFSGKRISSLNLTGILSSPSGGGCVEHEEGLDEAERGESKI
jgi:hypothetical protein